MAGITQAVYSSVWNDNYNKTERIKEMLPHIIKGLGRPRFRTFGGAKCLEPVGERKRKKAEQRMASGRTEEKTKNRPDRIRIHLLEGNLGGQTMGKFVTDLFAV